MPSAGSTPEPVLHNPYRQVLADPGPAAPWAAPGTVAAAVAIGMAGLAGAAHADPDEADASGASDVVTEPASTGGADLDLSFGTGAAAELGRTGDPVEVFADPDAEPSSAAFELDTPAAGGAADTPRTDRDGPTSQVVPVEVDRPEPSPDATARPDPRLEQHDVPGAVRASAPVAAEPDPLSPGPDPSGAGADAPDPLAGGGDEGGGDDGGGSGRPPARSTTAGPDPDDDPFGSDVPQDGSGEQPVPLDVVSGAAGTGSPEPSPRTAPGSRDDTAPGRPTAVDQPRRADRSLPTPPRPVDFATTTAEEIAAAVDAEVAAAGGRELATEREQLDDLDDRVTDILPAGGDRTRELITAGTRAQRRVDDLADGSHPQPLGGLDEVYVADGITTQVRELAAALGDPATVPAACILLVDLQCQAGDRPPQNGEDVVRRIAEETQPLLDAGQADAAALRAVQLMGEDFLDRGTLGGNAVTPEDVVASLLGRAPSAPSSTGAPVPTGVLVQLQADAERLLPSTTTTGPFHDAVDGLLRGTADPDLAEPQARLSELLDAAQAGDVFAACSAYLGLVAAYGGLPQDEADAAIAQLDALRAGSPEVPASRTLTPEEVRAYEVAHDAVFRSGGLTSVSAERVSPRDLSFLLDPLFRTDGIPRTGSTDVPVGPRPPRTGGPGITAGPSGTGPDSGTPSDAASGNWIERSGLPRNAFSGNVVDPRTGQVYAGGDTEFLLVESDYDRDVIADHTGSRANRFDLAPPLDVDGQQQWADALESGDFTVLDPDYAEGQRSYEASRGDGFDAARRLWYQLPLLTTENPGGATFDLSAAHEDLEQLWEQARSGGLGEGQDGSYPFLSTELARQAELAALQGRMADAQPLDTITMVACQIALLECTGDITPEVAARSRGQIDQAVSAYDGGIDLARGFVPDARLGSRYLEANDVIGAVHRLLGDNPAADAAAARVLPEVHPYRDGTSTYGVAPLPGIVPDELTHLQVHPHEFRALLEDAISPRELANLEAAVQSFMRGAQAIGYDSGGSGGPNVLPNAEQRERGLALLEEGLARYRDISRAQGFDSPDAVAAFGEAADLAAALRTAMLGELPVGAPQRTFELDERLPGDLWNQAEMGALAALYQAAGGGMPIDAFVLDTLGSSRIDAGNVPRQFVFSTHRPPEVPQDDGNPGDLDGLGDLADLLDLEEFGDVQAGGSAVRSRVTAGPATVPDPVVPTAPAGDDGQRTDTQQAPDGRVPSEPAGERGPSVGGVVVGGDLGRQPVSREELLEAMFPGGDPTRAQPPTGLEDRWVPEPGERVEFDPNEHPDPVVELPEATEGFPGRDEELERLLWPSGVPGLLTSPLGREESGAAAPPRTGGGAGEVSPALTPGGGTTTPADAAVTAQRDGPSPTAAAPSRESSDGGWLSGARQWVSDFVTGPVTMTKSEDGSTITAAGGVPFTPSAYVGVYDAETGRLLSTTRGTPPDRVATWQYMDPKVGAAVAAVAAVPSLAPRLLQAAGTTGLGSGQLAGAAGLGALVPVLPGVSERPALPALPDVPRALQEGWNGLVERAQQSWNPGGSAPVDRSAPATGSAGQLRVGDGTPEGAAAANAYNRDVLGIRTNFVGNAQPERPAAPVSGSGPAAPVPVVEQVREAAAPVVEQVREAAAPVVQRVQEATAPVVEQVREAAAPVVQRVQEATAPVVEQVREAAAPVVQRVQEATAPVVQRVQEAAAPVVQQVQNAVGALRSGWQQLVGGGR